MSAPTIGSVIRAANIYYGTDLRAIDRTDRTSRQRHVAMYAARVMAGKSYPIMGRFFRRDHATVRHGVIRVRKLLASDPRIAADLFSIAAIASLGVVQ